MPKPMAKPPVRALARELGMNADELRKGVTMVLHAGSNPSFLKSFYTAKGIEGEHGLIRSAVVHILGLNGLNGLHGLNGLFGGVSESASEWAMKAVDKLAAVMGGRTLKVFREIHGWNAALHTFIALRLASAIAKHDQLNMALQTGLQLEGTLQILAAKKFLETAMKSIRRFLAAIKLLGAASSTAQKVLISSSPAPPASLPLCHALRACAAG